MERSLVPLMAQERRDDLWQCWPVAPTPSPRFPTHFRSPGAVRGTVPKDGDGESRQPRGCSAGGSSARPLLVPPKSFSSSGSQGHGAQEGVQLPSGEMYC